MVACGPHENADKLSVCEVDTGDGENHSIVCGAPNVKSGIYVPVAKVGATLNNGDFKIKLATANQDELAYAYEELGLTSLVEKISTTTKKNEAKKTDKKKSSKDKSKD